MTLATPTATEAAMLRRLLRQKLASNRIHIVRALHEPEWWLESVVIGDVLCWCDGLDDAAVTRILVAVDLNWGRRVALLRESDQQRIFYAIKRLYPRVWDRWKERVR